MIKKGDKIILYSENDTKVIHVDGEIKRVSGIGVIDTSRFIDKEYGSRMQLGRKSYFLLYPTLKDMPELYERKAQVILPHIGAQIALHCDISNGDKVVEGGAGSGFLSSVLLRAVEPDGEVITYEIREDFKEVAERNIEKFDLKGNWTAKLGDVTKDVKETEVDAFIIDIPEPWKALKMAEKSLKKGGYFASYVPTTNQLERIVKDMRDNNYIAIKSFETLEREMVVNEGGVRPSYTMLGHTGYVTVGIRTS